MIMRKRCIFCEKKIDKIDYKNPIITNFVNERGKILPAKVTGVCAFHQRKLTKAVKKARQIALLPFVVQ